MSSPDSIEEIIAPFLGAQSVITLPVSTLSALFFIYGVHCVVFGLSIYALWQRGTVHKLYKWGSIALFTLATVFTTTYAWAMLNQTFIYFQAATTKDYSSIMQYLVGDTKKSALIGLTNFTSTLMNIIADIMLVHRCYVIYNHNKYMLCCLACVATCLNGIDFGAVTADLIAKGISSTPNNQSLQEKAQSIDSGAMIGIVVFQIVLSLMTGGRIWWFTWEARKLTTTRPSTTQFNNIVAIIIESAFLYAVPLLFATVLVNFLWDRKGNGVTPFDFEVVATLMSGLAPTMIIARVAYGKSLDSVQQTLSTFQIANPENSQQGSLAIRQHASSFQHQTQHAINIQEEEHLLAAGGAAEKA